MTHPVDRMLNLWRTPPVDDAAIAHFLDVYADPYLVNGEAIAVEAIVEWVRRLRASLAEFEQVVLERIDEENRTALLLFQSGLRLDPLATPLGALAPTGRRLTRRLVEFITHDDRRLVCVTAVVDDLETLKQAGAVSLLG